MSDNLNQLTLKQSSELLGQRQISSVELTQACLDQIDKHDDKTKAYVTVTADRALKQAQQADAAIANGDHTPLTGVPFSMKDAYNVKGVRTTASSDILSPYIAPYDCTVYRKLQDQNAVFIGKTNQDAFGHGGSTEHSDFFTSRNPWNLDKVPGGSSGGAAVSVSADMATFAIGEDTGGSIRQPSSLCSTTGLKVTYGRVSRYGAIAYASSLDTMGPMGKSVEDVAMVLEAIAGVDHYDSSSVPEEVPTYSQNLDLDLKGVKVGVPQEYYADGIDEQVKKTVLDAVAKYKELGATLVDISLPSTKYAIAAYYLVALCETSSNLARLDGVRYGLSVREDDFSWQEVERFTRGQGFGEEPKRRIMVGTYALSAGYYDAYYKKAMQARTLIKQEINKAFGSVDVMITPVSPFVAWDVGAMQDDPLQLWLADAYTVTINPSGVPALTLPCGFDSDNLPIGMQIIGPQFSEKLLLRVGHAYQQATDWHERKPKL